MKKSASSSLLRAHSRGSFSRLVFESETNNGGGHEDRSLLYRFFQLVVLLMRLVTPASYIFIITLTALQVPPTSFGQNIPFGLLTIWMIAEALFFPYYYYLFTQLNKSKSELEHFALNKRTRMRLVKNCFQALRVAACDSTPEVYIRKVIHTYIYNIFHTIF